MNRQGYEGTHREHLPKEGRNQRNKCDEGSRKPKLPSPPSSDDDDNSDRSRKGGGGPGRGPPKRPEKRQDESTDSEDSTGGGGQPLPRPPKTILRSTTERNRSALRKSKSRSMSLGLFDSLGAEDEHEMVYENAIVQKIRDTIYDRVGTEPEYDIAGMKNIKPAPPEKYGGEDDIESFENWLAGVLRWLRVAGVTGKSKEQLQVDLCGTTLKGLAADWFHLEVESFDRKIRNWTFTELIVAMYGRFIHEVTAQNATIKFYNAKYSKSKGVLSFYNDLERFAGRMVARPDDYTFRRQLLRGLPQDMVEVLIKTRKVTAEHTSLPRLLQEAKAMESAFQAVEQHKKDRQTTAHDRSGHVVVATVSQNSGKTVRFNTSRRPGKFRSVSTPSVVSTNSQNRSQQGQSSSSWRRRSSPAHRSGNSRPPSRSFSGPSQRPGPSTSSSQTKIAKPAGSSSANKVTCFTCGQEGHYSTSCPNNKPKVYAAQVTDTEDEHQRDQETDHDRDREPHEEHETQDEGDLGGSQYTSGEEEYPLEQYEEYDGSEPEYPMDNESDNTQTFGLRVLEDCDNGPSVSLRTMITSEETQQNIMRSSLKRTSFRTHVSSQVHS